MEKDKKERSVEEFTDEICYEGAKIGAPVPLEIYRAITQTLQAERQKREEQAKRYITLMNQALGQTELPEDVWKKIAKVN